MDTRRFVDRISLNGSLDEFVLHVIKIFQLGKDFTYTVIQIGYEDLNIKLYAGTNTYILKSFGSYKTDAMCRRYVDIMSRIISAGIRHPKIFSANGSYLQEYKMNSSDIRYCLLECIEGKSLYDLDAHPSIDEAIFLIREAAKINDLDITTEDYYDEWSPVNFSREYESKKQHVSEEFREYLKTFHKKFSAMDMSELSQAFVHSDIIRANVIKNALSNLTIIDYSKAAHKPRLQELSVLLCGMFFDETNPISFQEYIELVKKEYVPILSVTEYEKLQLFIIAVFAMYAMGGEYCRQVLNLHTKENEYWIRLGTNGLRYCQTQWKF